MLRRPDLEGKLAIAFTIGNIGSVLSSRVLQSSMDDPRLGDCVLAKLASWKFPKPKGGIEVPVTYPFVFKSLGKG
jgi:TonB family protein